MQLRSRRQVICLRGRRADPDEDGANNRQGNKGEDCLRFHFTLLGSNTTYSSTMPGPILARDSLDPFGTLPCTLSALVLQVSKETPANKNASAGLGTEFKSI